MLYVNFKCEHVLWIAQRLSEGHHPTYSRLGSIISNSMHLSKRVHTETKGDIGYLEPTAHDWLECWPMSFRDLPISAHPSPRPGVVDMCQLCLTSTWVLCTHAGLHACVAATLLTEPSPTPSLTTILLSNTSQSWRTQWRRNEILERSHQQSVALTLLIFFLLSLYCVYFPCKLFESMIKKCFL